MAAAWSLSLLADNLTAVTFGATVLFAIFWYVARSAENLSKIIFGGLILHAVFVTLYFSPEYQNIVIGKDIGSQVIVFSLFLLWISHLTRNGGFTLAPTPLNAAVLIFFLVSVLSAFLAPRWAWYYSLEEIARVASVLLMFFLAVKFLNTRDRWNIGLYAILGCMVLTCVYGYLQIRGFDFVEWGRKVNVSTFGNKDFFASFLTYTLPITIGLTLASKNAFDTCVHLAASLLGLYHIVDGETRGAWLGLIAFVIAAIWFEIRLGRFRKILNSKSKWIIAAVAVLLVIALFAAVTPGHKSETFQSIFQAHSGTNLIRVYIWWTSLHMWMDDPMFGQGIGSYQLTYPFFRIDRYNRIGMSHNTRHAHSEELEILSEQGIVGFSAWLAVFALFFIFAFRKLRRIETLPERYIFFGLIGGILAGFVHDALNVNLRWTSSAVAFWLIVALAVRYMIGFDPPPSPKSAKAARPDFYRETPLGLVLCAAFAFMFHLEYRTLRADYYLHIVEGTAENSRTQRMSVDMARKTLQLLPYDHSAMYKSSFAHLNLNEFAEARDMYFRLLALAPNYAQVHQNTALLAYQDYMKTRENKHLFQAILEFEWATSLENNFVNHSKILQLYAQAVGDLKRARYHNQFLLWNSREDLFFAMARYWHTASIPHVTHREKEVAWREWVKGIVDFGAQYWLNRLDVAQKTGRTRNEIRYAARSAVLQAPDHPGLVDLVLTALVQPSDDDEADVMYVIHLLEQLPAGQLAEAAGYAAAIEKKNAAAPIRAYALGLIRLRQGDREAAKRFFEAARTGGSQYQVISKGIQKYDV